MSNENQKVFKEDKFKDTGMMTIFYALELYGENASWCDESEDSFNIIDVITSNNKVDANAASVSQKLTNNQYKSLLYSIRCAKGYASWEKSIEINNVLNLLITLRSESN